MKRITCAVMAAALLLTLAACGSSIDINYDSPSTQEPTPAQEPTPTLEPTPTQEATPPVQEPADPPIDAKLLESVTAKDVFTGKTSTVNGYEAEYTVSITGLIKASEAEALQLAWEGVAGKGDVMPSISSFHSYTNDGFSETNAAVLFGKISFRNTTQGFDITKDNPASFTVWLRFGLEGGFGIPVEKDPKMYINYTDGKYGDFNVRPLMEQNTWGPVAFMVVFPNVIIPKDPDGDEMKDLKLFVDGIQKNMVDIQRSW